jgi:hypothetical protein
MSEMTSNPVRPFYWSVRRELWENRSIYVAPVAVAGFVLLGFLFSLHNLPQAAHVLSGPKPGPDATPAAMLAYNKQAMSLMVPQFAGFAILVVSLVVAVFYCLGSLHAERRDRSVLFWKSLPVSDRTTVLSKAFVPLVVCLFELMDFRTHYAWSLLHSRLMDGFAAFTVGGLGKQPLHDITQIDPTPFLTSAGFWGGLVFAAAAFAGCVWLRRRSDPI